MCNVKITVGCVNSLCDLNWFDLASDPSVKVCLNGAFVGETPWEAEVDPTSTYCWNQEFHAADQVNLRNGEHIILQYGQILKTHCS